MDLENRQALQLLRAGALNGLDTDAITALFYACDKELEARGVERKAYLVHTRRGIRAVCLEKEEVDAWTSAMTEEEEKARTNDCELYGIANIVEIPFGLRTVQDHGCYIVETDLEGEDRHLPYWVSDAPVTPTEFRYDFRRGQPAVVLGVRGSGKTIEEARAAAEKLRQEHLRQEYLAGNLIRKLGES